MREIKIIAAAEDAGARIDKYISEQEDLSRSRVQALLAAGSILVNQNAVKANYKVKADDCITAVFNDEMEMEARPEKMELDVRYEDEDVIVINKPKNIVVHPAAGNQSGTLVNGLLYHCKDLSGINGTLRPGIVHRIDKDTTGLLIIAKNDLAHASLSKQLQSKTVNRLYYALVHGVIQHDFGTIDAPIGRDVKDRQKMAVTATNSKDARTHFQIRVHMQYIGHPVVGDEKYSYRKTMQTNGQLLHAHQLTFQHPRTGEVMTVEAELPKQFADILEELRQESR